MAENLIHQLIPHQGCVISRTVDGVDIAGSAMNSVMSAGVAPLVARHSRSAWSAGPTRQIFLDNFVGVIVHSDGLFLQETKEFRKEDRLI